MSPYGPYRLFVTLPGTPGAKGHSGVAETRPTRPTASIPEEQCPIGLVNCALRCFATPNFRARELNFSKGNQARRDVQDAGAKIFFFLFCRN